MRRKGRISIAALAALASIWGVSASATETVRVGVSPLAADAPIAIAMAKGYFAAQGLELKLHFFHAQQPIAVAVGSGDLDIGLAAHTAALFNLGADHRAMIIAGSASQAPTFHYLALVASNKAYAAGLKSPQDFPGHSFALTQMGTGLQYSLSRIAAHYGFDEKKVTLLPLQSNPNIASALIGGRADSAAFDATNSLPLIEKGQVKLIGWVGDVLGVSPAFLLFASYDLDQHHADTVKRFVTAYREASRDFYNAFTDAHGNRQDQPSAPAVLDIIAKYVNQPVARVKLGLPYFDPDAALDPTAIQEIIDWYRAIGALKPKVLASQVIDKRYVPLRSAKSAAAK
jgi:NitT/TauT family transport system substrate-binding protein